jgi:hypothetical protein
MVWLSFEVLGSTVAALLVSFPRLVRQAFERLEPCEGKLSCTVLRGLGGSNPARLLDRGWVLFGAKPAQSETPVRAAAKRRPPGGERSGERDGVAFRLRVRGQRRLLRCSSGLSNIVEYRQQLSDLCRVEHSLHAARTEIRER